MPATRAGPDDASDALAGLAGRNRWEWIQPAVTAMSVVLPLICATLAATDERADGRSKVVGAMLAVAFAAWSLSLGRSVHRSAACDGVFLPLVFVIVQYALFTGMAITNPVYFFVAFALYWQTFTTLPLGWAIPTSVVLSGLMVALQLAYSGKSLIEQPTAALTGVFSIAFGTIMAVWIGGIIDQSRERASLIGELEATRTELAAISRDAGALAERQRLAHEIHDTLAQGFTSIVMLAQAADALTDTDPLASHRHLQSIERTARDNLTEARHLVEGMGPAALSSGSLIDALHRLTDRLAGDLGIDATTEIQGEVVALAPAVEVTLLRIAQEALANVRKHAGAAHVRVVLRFEAPTNEADGDRANGDRDAQRRRDDLPGPLARTRAATAEATRRQVRTRSRTPLFSGPYARRHVPPNPRRIPFGRRRRWPHALLPRQARRRHPRRA